MASDLSQTIPENLSTTLSALLAKDTHLKECTKVDIRDFQNIELLKVDVEFVFDKLTSLFTYYIPATSASKIFNIMMAAPDGDILSNIDDDTSDAMTEFISNTCGGLVTTINGSDFPDIGKSKFNIKHKETLLGNDLETIENIYRFLIDIEGKEIVVFTKFEENFNNFIAELTAAETTFYPEEQTNQTEQEDDNKPKDEIKKEEEEVKEEEVEVKEEEPTNEDKPSTNKNKKIKIIIIAVIATIVVALLILIVLNTSSNSNEQIDIENKQKETLEKKEPEPKVSIPEYVPLKKVEFNISDINTNRLNNKFELLTKYQVLTQEELEIQANEEKQRIIDLKKEQFLIEFAKENKEEPLVIKETTKEEDTPSITKPEELTPNQEINKEPEAISDKNNKLKFVLANSLKYKLFKKLVVQTNSTKARISICNSDNGKTQIFIGPFENEELQIKMNSSIRDKDKTIQTIITNITQEEFESKCNF